MMQKLGDISSERALAAFAGRAREVEALLQLFEQGGPLALYVHGVAGIGKSSLLEVFAARVRATGARRERWLAAEEVAERLAFFDERIVIALDTYEVFRLMDTWIRQVFIPSLPV